MTQYMHWNDPFVWFWIVAIVGTILYSIKWRK